MLNLLTKDLSRFLESHISLGSTRRQTLIWLIFGVIHVGTVNLSRLCDYVDTRVCRKSVLRRFERFFQYVCFDPCEIARFIIYLSPLGKSPWDLALDRTNWKFGRCELNILVLCVIIGDTGLPLFWTFLNKAGNSNSTERIDLLGRFVETFPEQAIASLYGDREFIGEKWMAWLCANNVPFVLRLRANMQICKEGYAPVSVGYHANKLKKKESRVLKGKWCLGQKERVDFCLNIAMKKLANGELLIVASHGVRPKLALVLYRKRWAIETLFANLKSRGFGLEDTHMTHPKKLSTLMAVLAIATCLTYKCGRWAIRFKPLKKKAHGRWEQSIFSRGLGVLRTCLSALSPFETAQCIWILFTTNAPRIKIIQRFL